MEKSVFFIEKKLKTKSESGEKPKNSFHEAHIELWRRHWTRSINGL